MCSYFSEAFGSRLMNLKEDFPKQNGSSDHIQKGNKILKISISKIEIKKIITDLIDFHKQTIEEQISNTVFILIRKRTFNHIRYI